METPLAVMTVMPVMIAMPVMMAPILALAFSTPGFTCTNLAAGAAWLALLAVPAIAGAARTETASSAAEMVLIMVVSS